MLIVHIHVQVKAECVEAFKKATIANACRSVREPGIARFDVLQADEDPSRFVLIEAYLDEAAPADHKKTEHYATWRDAVEPMMAKPRQRESFSNIFPEDAEW